MYEVKPGMQRCLGGLPLSARESMRYLVRTAGIAAIAAAGLARGAAAQATHEIRMEVDQKRGEYRFVPSRVNAKPGDVLVFRTVSGAPHSVVFEAGGLDGGAHEAINAAMPRRSGDLSSPLLTRNGAEYRVTVPRLAKGSYPFFCLPHRAYDMRGELVVE
jgi:plastocyanin